MLIYKSNSTSPTFNLATEEYLFNHSTEDLLFLYVNQASVIVGSNQVVQNEVNIEFCAENNIEIVRRMSGGGTVYHDLGNLNYSFIVNKSEDFSILSSHFLELLIGVLKFLSIPVNIGKRKDLWLPNGHKVSGTASHVSKNKVLFHGTLLYDSDLFKLKNALLVNEKNPSLKGVVSVPSPVVNIKSYLSNNGLEVAEIVIFYKKFIDQIMATLNMRQLIFFNNNEIEQIKQTQTKRYLNKDWIFKK